MIYWCNATLHIKMNYSINKIKCSIGNYDFGYTTTLHIKMIYSIKNHANMNKYFNVLI